MCHAFCAKLYIDTKNQHCPQECMILWAMLISSAKLSSYSQLLQNL